MAKKENREEASNLFRPQKQKFWEAVQVYPTVIGQESGIKDYRAQALKQLKKCGFANLRLLTERAGIACPKEATPQNLAALLLSKDEAQTLLALAEFVRGKGRAINEEYEAHFPDTTRRKYSSHLTELSNRPKGGIRQFVKLLLLYDDDPDSVRRIFVRKLWRARRTEGEFRVSHKITREFLKSVTDDRHSLADALSDAFSGYDLRFFDSVRLGEWEILLFQREYAPIVRPDYRDTKKTIHGFGWIMLGFECDQSRILIKGGGAKALGIVQTWFSHSQNVTLAATEGDVDAFAAYDPTTVENSLLGDYPQESSVRLLGINFRRSLTPNHSPLSIEPSYPGQDIRRDLQFAREKGLVRVRSLSDIASFKLEFQSREAKVEVQVETGGGVILRLDNSELSEQEVDDLRSSFAAAFGVPLDRRIDPQNLILGSVDVYNRLLELDRADDLAQYQRVALKRLVKDQILVEEPKEIVVCPKPAFICKAGGKPVFDEDLTECPECQTMLESRHVVYLQHNEKVIIKRAGELLADATKWKFVSRGVTFEGEKFYPLLNPERPDQVIRVYFVKRVGNRLLELLDRSLQPVLVVHTGGLVDHAHLDVAGVVHISFARALASQEDKEIATRFRNDCEQARDDLIRRQTQKALKRAHDSRQRIVQPPTVYTGEDYQLDVFNVIRSIFPYSEYWTGTNRPDGFCSLVYFEGASLRKARKHNWSYDAKFTRDPEGYDINADKERQAWDYVAALAIQPDLCEQDNELNGHAIVSNCLSQDQMAKLAAFIRREHRLGKDLPNIKTVFLLDEFLIELFDCIRVNEDLFRKRWPSFSQQMAKFMKQENSEGYVLLNKAKAVELTKWVLEHGEIETPPNIERLRKDLDATMTKS